MRTFARAASDVTVVLVFLSLGANLPFDTLADHAAPALVTLVALIAVARPLTVLVCLLPDRGSARRHILVAEGIPHEEELVTVVSLAIIVTLLAQSTTKRRLARHLGLDRAGA